MELFVLVPVLLAFLFCLIFRDKRIRSTGYVSVIASLASLAMVIYMALFLQQGTQSIDWFSVGGYVFSLQVTSAHINMMLLFLVALISPLIMIYSLGFFEDVSEHRRFYAEMNLFAASMMLFSISANFLSMIIAWEGLGITSYLLIGFWYAKSEAARAARESISIIIIGDVAMLAALIILFNAYGTTSFYSISAQPISYPLYAAFLLVVLAVLTKSAQFPFSGWLPKAMEGPTPVSAFLHSSTMVKAGVFLLILFIPVLLKLGLLPVILLLGAITAGIGVLNALSGKHIKRILAYSTLEDLGLMLVAVGLNAVFAAILLFVTQTFYKALLFLDAGSISRANGEEYDITKLRESGGNRLIFITAVIGVLSIAGIFPFSGFLGKVGLEVSANSIYTYIFLVLVEIGTGFYIFRWLFIPMKNSGRMEIKGKLKSTPVSMILPQVLLALFVIGGISVYFFLPSYLGIKSLSLSYLRVIAETIFAIAGTLVAYYIYRRGQTVKVSKGLFVFVHSIDGINWFYLKFAAFIEAISKFLGFLDYFVYMLFYLFGFLSLWVGKRLRNLVNGNVNMYAAWIAIGFALILLALVFRI